MSFCAGFYFYQGSVKNARKLLIGDCRMQIEECMEIKREREGKEVAGRRQVG
jgi:hypothetical protein